MKEEELGERLNPEDFGIVPAETTPLGNVRMETEFLGRLGSSGKKRHWAIRLAGTILGLMMLIGFGITLYWIFLEWDASNLYGLVISLLGLALGLRILWVNVK